MSAVEQAVAVVEEVIDTTERKECAYYDSKLLEKARDETFPVEIRQYLNVIAQVATYHFREENTHEPYGPMVQTSEGRSPIPADLNDEDLTRLQELASRVSAPELKARCYDVLWLRKRDFALAEEAVAAYIAGAEASIDLEHWTYCAELAERALRLASLFRRKESALFDRAADLLQTWVDEYADADERFLTARCIRLLLQFGAGDPARLHDRARAVAARASARDDLHCAEEYWRQAVKCARAADDEEAAIAAQTELAECLVANARANKASGMNAAHWMQQAIEAYKAVPGSQQRREDLYVELREYQQASLKEMGKVTTPFDISDLLKWTTDVMAGRDNARDALFAFAFELATPLNYSKLKQQAKDIAEKYPLSNLFSATHLDQEGKVVARSEGSFDSADGVSAAQVYRLAAMEHQLIVAGKIYPAIEIVTQQHELTEEVWTALLENNPFVAAGQAPLYAKAFRAGFEEDFGVALSVVIPLIENSLRVVLGQFGVRTSTLNASGVQEVLRMGAILEHEKTTEIFGADMVRDLQGLLLDRTYGNLRNDFSHGLLAEGAFYQPCAIYLWWLALRLCLTPMYVAEQKTAEE